MPAGSSKRPTGDDSDNSEDEAEAGLSTLAVEDEIGRRPSSSRHKKKKSTISPGIVYISRLPPGMTPQKVKHLMARWGDVGKVYAQRKDSPGGYNPNADRRKAKHAPADYSEAWVEFDDKSIAKTVAKMLNAEVVGGKKGDRWRDDIWTMKYLSGFRWEMLGEQVAYERQAHQSRLRAEVARSKTEQGEYLRNVELARVLDKRRAKKAAQKSETPDGSTATRSPVAMDVGVVKAKGRYHQRQVVEREGMKEKRMEGILGNVFG